MSSHAVPTAADLPPPWDGEIDTSDAFLEATREMVHADPALLLAVSAKAHAQAMAREDWAGAARAVARRASAEQALGMASADASWEEADALVERSGDTLLRLRALVSKTATLSMAGRYADSLALCRQALDEVLAIGKVETLRSLLLNMAVTLCYIDEPQLALECLEERRRLLPSDGPLSFVLQAETDCNVAWAWLSIARRGAEEGETGTREVALRAALEAARRGYEAAGKLRNPELLMATATALVDALLAAGRVAEARGVAVELASAMPPHSEYLRAEVTMIDVTIGLQEGADARSLVQKLRGIESLHHREFEVGPTREKLLSCMSTALERSGDFEEALRYLRLHADEWARRRSIEARERARAMRQAMIALRQESVEFLMHDLRSPLAAAMQQIDSALLEAPPPQWAAHLRTIAGSVGRAITAAEQTLGILRAEHVPQEQLVPVDLTDLADDVCEQLAPPPGASKGVSRELNGRVTVRGERSLLVRALANLVGNALEHTRPGSRVVVRVERVDDDAVLSVHDHGPGLEPSMRARLFRRYSTGRAKDGHGLGLALVARVARVHGARIDVDSEAGLGTRITLRFKVLDPPAA